MAKKLADKLDVHKSTFFQHRDGKKHAGGAEWYLHQVIFPALRDIAERLDTLETAKGTDVVPQPDEAK